MIPIDRPPLPSEVRVNVDDVNIDASVDGVWDEPLRTHTEPASLRVSLIEPSDRVVG